METFSLKKKKCKSKEYPGTPKDLEVKEMGNPGSVPTCFCQKASCRQWDTNSRAKGSAINQPTIVQLNQKQFQSCYEAQIFDFKNYITVHNVILIFLNQSYVEKLPPCRCICIDNTPLTSGYIFLPRA